MNPWRAFWWVALTLLSQSGSAHELSMAEMQVRQTASGEFLWQWMAAERPPGQELRAAWPDGCVEAENLLRCDEEGLRGRLEIQGLGKRYSAALVKVFWADGASSVYTFTSAQRTAQLFGSAVDRRSGGEIARAYGLLGIEHILSGFDHLLFVLALLFLVGFNRRLVWTITAFTVAHSVTLALSALGWLTLRSPPVEATIALSIMLVAGEALHGRQTLARRWPALVAFLFGLVHGLGFAGALQEIGLPENHLPVALLTFNGGVELGQLLVVALAYGLYRTFARWPQLQLARVPALYSIGVLAAYWSIERIVAILGSSTA
jgi:hydrogenase/urease accessory protein HupE